MSTTTGVSYYLTDHVLSTAALIDTTGNLLEQLSYDSLIAAAENQLTQVVLPNGLTVATNTMASSWHSAAPGNVLC